MLDICNPVLLWTSEEGETGEKAELLIDLICPHRLKEVKIINGFGEFRTNEFSVLGSFNSSGPWSRLFKGKLENSGVEVGYFGEILLHNPLF